MQSTNVIDLTKYRSFCFRGEGRCNFVISAKNKQSNLRIVWRFAKHRKSGMMTEKPKCQIVNQYLEKIISHFLSNTYLIKVKVVYIPSDNLHHLAKIPSLPHNLKIDLFEELQNEEKYPSNISFFRYYKNLTKNENFFVCALEMFDATQIPQQLNCSFSPTVTIEIKPKQGFFQSHPGINLPFCNNCILQIEKWRSATFKAMYDFCPLDLYSGDRNRMQASIDSLIRDPHRNLQIFVDGSVVHNERKILSRQQLGKICFPTVPIANVDTLISVIQCILAGVKEDCLENFYLQEKSVLSDLLKAQKIDTIGIIQAHKYFSSLPLNVQHELMNESNLLNTKNNLLFLKKNDPRSLVERYLLAATMKDCSLMISFRLIDKSCVNESNIKIVKVPTSFINLKNKFEKSMNWLYFAYSTRIVDLDPKTAKNLKNAHKRFVAGVKTISANPYIHKPCRI